MSADVRDLAAAAAGAGSAALGAFRRLRDYLSSQIIGQERLVERLLVVLLADEINRAPAKVQSALLEAMAERQVSVGAASYRLPQLFLAMATQNDFVSPEDVQGIAPDALRHRLLLDYGAQARGIDAQTCVDELLEKVPAP